MTGPRPFPGRRRSRSRSRSFAPRHAVAWVVASVLVVGLASVLALPLGLWHDPAPPAVDRPPPPGGHFETLPPGTWRSLPGDRSCAEQVRRSAWEPRPENYVPNHRVPDRDRVRQAFAARPRATEGAYAPRWDRWLLQRVSGQFVGTTDEILQWASCKWGVADDVLRAVALRESGWYQHQVYPDGTCVTESGCGDLLTEPSQAGRMYCRRVAEVLHGGGRALPWAECPRTFSIVGVMSWHDPAWGRLRGNQNGTFPFNVRSTAFAVDYLASFLRGCLEGWVRWLGNSGDYRAGDLEGCLGAWYAGTWKSADARSYTARVQEAQQQRPWLQADWARQELPCLPDRGCPQAAP